MHAHVITLELLSPTLRATTGYKTPKRSTQILGNLFPSRATVYFTPPRNRN